MSATLLAVTGSIHVLMAVASVVLLRDYEPVLLLDVLPYCVGATLTALAMDWTRR